MSETFSELTLAFDRHLGDLDRARKVFVEEVGVFNEYVAQRLMESCGIHGDGVKKLRWGSVENWSVQREVTWLNWYVGTRIPVDIRPPGHQRFKCAAAFLYFEVRYSRTRQRFRFRCRLENENRVSTDLDEVVMDIVRRRRAEFPDSDQVKTNTAILFGRDIGESLLDELGHWVGLSLDAVAEAVDELFPDSAYSVDEVVEEDDRDDPMPEGMLDS